MWVWLQVSVTSVLQEEPNCTQETQQAVLLQRGLVDSEYSSMTPNLQDPSCQRQSGKRCLLYCDKLAHILRNLQCSAATDAPSLPAHLLPLHLDAIAHHALGYHLVNCL
jgi:hypothetical protein